MPSYSEDRFGWVVSAMLTAGKGWYDYVVTKDKKESQVFDIGSQTLQYERDAAAIAEANKATAEQQQKQKEQLLKALPVVAIIAGAAVIGILAGKKAKVR